MLDRGRFVVDDAAWEKVAPLLPGKPTDPGGTGKNNRLFLEAVLHLADSGCKWRQLPDRFGAWDAVYNRFRRRVRAGVFGRLFADLPAQVAAGVDGARRVFVDSTVVRAHASAAGAPAAKGGRRGRPSGGAGAGSGPSSTRPRPTTGRRSRSS